MRIALDATYSLGEELTGVGIYSREILSGLAGAHPGVRFEFWYRAHRFRAGLRERVPPNVVRRLLQEPLAPRGAALFHGLNQRLPKAPLRRTVTTFHDLFVLTSEFSTPEFRRRFTELARDAAERSQRIIAVSSFTASQVRELLGVEPERLLVIPHGVHPASPPAEENREDLILHVGAIQTRKNLARLIRAFEVVSQRQPGWRLVLAGPAGYGAADILRRVEESPFRSQIDITGYVPVEELRRLYRRARVFAFPSLGEGFGIPVLEAMAHGVAVLTSNRTGLPEAAGGAALLVEPESEEGLTDGLWMLVSDPEKRAELVRMGLERAKRQPWSVAVTKTWDVYRELL